MPKNVLLIIDWKMPPQGWSFYHAIQQFGHTFHVLDADIPVKYASRLTRMFILWGGWMKLGWRAFRRRKTTDVILAYQGVAGLCYALISRLLFARGPRLVIMGFFFRLRAKKPVLFFRKKLIEFVLPRIDRVICYSSAEARQHNAYFKNARGKFVFCHYAIKTEDVDVEAVQRDSSGCHVFSAGASNRDYRTLFRAVDGLDIPVTVIAKAYNTAGLDVPKNVTLKFDVYGDEFRRDFLNSRFVVIPLWDPELSSGLMVLLDAMMHGKAPIITRTATTADYVEDGVDGLLCDPYKPHQLGEKIHYLWTNPERAREIGLKAKETVMTRINMTRFAENVSQIIDELP